MLADSAGIGRTLQCYKGVNVFEELDLKIGDKKKPDSVCPIQSVLILCNVRYTELCRCEP